MKFTITREQLAEGVKAVYAAVPSKTTLPVLANILLEATSDGLRLSGTDLDIAVATTAIAVSLVNGLRGTKVMAASRDMAAAMRGSDCSTMAMIEASRPTTRPEASISTHFFSMSAGFAVRVFMADPIWLRRRGL